MLQQHSIHTFSKLRQESKVRRHLHEPVGGTPTHVCRKFRPKKRRSDLSVFNIEQKLAKKLDPGHRTKKFEGNNASYAFSRTKVQMSTPFLRDER